MSPFAALLPDFTRSYYDSTRRIAANITRGTRTFAHCFQEKS